MDRQAAHRESLCTVQEERPNRHEHLLRVAGSVNRDAAEVWTQLWGEIKPHVTSSGAVLPGLEKGFVPECGWPEFLERMWLLKHYLDSTNRICQGK